MASGDSPVSICNIALIALGEDPITSLSDNTKRAIVCKARYDDIRRALLRSHPWNCARKQRQLPADPVAPLFKWQRRYAMPADFLRFYAEDNDSYDMAIWEIMADDTGTLFIYSNDSAPLNVTYIYDLQDTTKMDSLFVQAFAFQLASELAISLSQNSQRAQQALAMMEGKLSISRFAGAQENAPKEWDVDILLRARR